MKTVLIFLSFFLISVFAFGDHNRTSSCRDKTINLQIEKKDSTLNGKNYQPIKLKMVSSLYIAPENWTDVGDGKDSKFGIGFNWGKVQIAPTFVTLTGVAKAAKRLEIRVGVSF